MFLVPTLSRCASFLLILSCRSPGPPGEASPADTAWWPPCTDEDGDFYCVEDGDCDDSDEEVNPGAEECVRDANGIDDDCDGAVDE